MASGFIGQCIPADDVSSGLAGLANLNRLTADAAGLTTIQHQYLCVTSRTVVWLFLKQFRFECVPVLHSLQGRLAA
jgi:hypothetical protein